MTTRAYDYLVTLANVTNITKGSQFFVKQTNVLAEVIDVVGSTAKVRVSNLRVGLSVGENVVRHTAQLYYANTINVVSSNLSSATSLSFPLPNTNPLADSISVYINNEIVNKDLYIVNTSNIVFLTNTSLVSEAGSFEVPNSSRLAIQVATGNTYAPSFVSANLMSYTEVANTYITAVAGAPYIAEKNSVEQTPIVKLYTIYYPGDWYPKNSKGNPGHNDGIGRPWPKGFPLRFAEFVGETYSDSDYSVLMDGEEFRTVALNGADIGTDTTGTINSSTLEISNFDGNITSIIDNKYIVGYCANSASAYINGELLNNIDPRTVVGNVHYDSGVVAVLGNNAICDYETTVERGETWELLKQDSRDLLGAVVEVRITYAKFLDYWPEYSIAKSAVSNVVTVYSGAPYRVGDIVTIAATGVQANVTAIIGNNVHVDSTSFSGYSGERLYIVNPDADREAFVEYLFVINRLEQLNEISAKFNLTNWLQYFKMKLPKRTFVHSTCGWKYKGVECKYPENGSGPIIGSVPQITSNGLFTIGNVPTLSVSEDSCAHTITACALRKNLTNFGGFVGVVI